MLLRSFMPVAYTLASATVANCSPSLGGDNKDFFSPSIGLQKPFERNKINLTKALPNVAPSSVETTSKVSFNIFSSFGVKEDIEAKHTSSSAIYTHYGSNIFNAGFLGVVALCYFAPVALSVKILAGAATYGAAVALEVSSLSTKQQASVNFKEVGAIIPPSMLPQVTPPEHTFCGGFPTQHSSETEVWREEMILAAEHNILLSGNFCGGIYFRKVLQLIEKRINEKPSLQVVILGSPGTLNEKDIQAIDRLLKKFPGNFSFIKCPEEYVQYPHELKKTGNHTKCLVIDYGKYFMMGGSGIKQNFTETGEDKYSRKDYRQGKERDEVSAQKRTGEAVDKENSLIEAAVNPPGGWRDMDFVCKSSDENPAGIAVFQQLALLIFKYDAWERFKKEQPAVDLKPEDLAVFTGTPPREKKEGGVLTNLLQTPIPSMGSISTRIERYENTAKAAKDMDFKLLCTGPDMQKNIYAEAVLSHIKQAEKRIVISHMYFHPNEEIMKALIDAANRGVKIQIITNGPHALCQKAVMPYRAKSFMMYRELWASVKDPKNVEIFEYAQQFSAYHKKVIVLDDTVITGSSNFAYKSLGPMSDHELNFIAKSPSFAEESLKVLEADITLSKKIESPSYFNTWWYWQSASWQDKMKHEIG
jgi:phosphatidylserine/phosphatidylglycerophosphate/cardiolipin synthase-like enzyme